MTGKEALEIIVRKHSISETDKEDEELEKCYKCVMSDLEVLEILKRHLVVETEDDERKELGESVNCYLKSWLSSDKEDYQKVKEWLENE
jgi:hypothetical protein